MQIFDKTRPTEKEVVVLLDASSSMMPHRNAVINTFNEYVSKLTKENLRVTLYTFNNSGLLKLSNRELASQFTPLTVEEYFPTGSTPLYDAIWTILCQHKSNNINFVIHTDGEENCSKEIYFEQLNDAIKVRTEQGCQFTWLGEGLVGASQLDKFYKGIKINFAPGLRGQAFSSVLSATTSYATTGSVVEDKINLGQ